MARKLLVATTYFLLSVAGLQAQGLTGGDLVLLCGDRSSPEWRHQGQHLCPAFIRGLIEGTRIQALHTAGSIEGHWKLLPFCEPENSTSNQAIDIVVRFIEIAPDRLKPLAVAPLVVEAFKEAWPCKR